jgi:hypothetical protein
LTCDNPTEKETGMNEGRYDAGAGTSPSGRFDGERQVGRGLSEQARDLQDIAEWDAEMDDWADHGYCDQSPDGDGTEDVGADCDE